MKRIAVFWMLVTATVCLTPYGQAANSARVEFVPTNNAVKVLIGGQHVTTYLYGDQLTKPCLYPVKTPDGIILNRGFPLTKVEGETTDHAHHVGLFFTYDDVNGDGFWNNKTSPPQVKHIKFTATEPGDTQGTLGTLSHWIAKDGQTVLLDEHRTMIFKPIKSGYAIDFKLDLTARKKVEFGDTKEGMFAIRTADWLREKGGTGKYFSSEGATGSKNIWGRRAKWVALEGKQGGQVVGIAILDHPSSVNYPTYWHARDYGLFSANPLGQLAFQKSTKVANPTPLHLTLESGQTAHFRFLVLVYEGARTREQIEAEFQKFAR